MDLTQPDNPADPGRPKTSELTETATVSRDFVEPDVTYRPAPHAETPTDADGNKVPTWRVRFELVSDPAQCFGLEINGELVFGRGGKGTEFVDLTPYGADAAGVSRRHFSLRPTISNLYVVDERSTNGTILNGRPIGVANPASLFDRATLAAGKLQFYIRILERPRGHTAALRAKADLADLLTTTAKAITSQMDLSGILNQVAEAASTLTDAGESGVWLLDQETSELYLEAQWGITDEEVKRLRLPARGDDPVSQVIKSGEILRLPPDPKGGPIKINTDYLVASLLCVPLKLGGQTFGVLACAHRDAGRAFDPLGERILTSIADFAAIAVQNARLYKAADDALAQRVKELAALNELAYSVSSSLDLREVHKVLMEQVTRHWQVEAASLWLYDDRTRAVELFGAVREPEAILAAEREIVQAVVEKGKPMLSTELLQKKKLSVSADEPAKETTARMEAQSLACVPLIIQERTVGALALYARRIGAFKDEDLDRLQSFANPVAIAIQNARLYADTEHKQATVEATVNTLDQPLMILDEGGDIVVANEAARKLLASHMAQVFEGLSAGIGRTVELAVGNRAFLTTSQTVEGIGTIIVMQDITYVKKLETARGEFVQALSHDLKSPLASIKGWAYLLPQVSQLDDRGQQFVKRISDASDNVLHMLSQLLDIALLSESPRFDHRAVDLLAESQKAIRSVEGAALARSQKVTFEREGDPYYVRGDPMRLYRSLLNLLDNAIKYAPESTEILVRLAYSKDSVKLSVRDDGPGIPDKDLPHIFEQYFRGEQALGKQPGIGLGLTLVQSTARAHGGSVMVHNVEGHGAEFVITLPGSLKTDTGPLAE